MSALNTAPCKSPADLQERVAAALFREAEAIANRATKVTEEEDSRALRYLERKLDDFLTSRRTGFLLMTALLAFIFWLTLVGTNYPSEALARLFSWGEKQILAFLGGLNAPLWLQGILVEGIYRTVSWVVAVMLPPMAIFFSLFALLEDVGYLPRVAFNLDRLFRATGAHGKQALTMAMGFGCNAVGVTACRIIEAPRERLLAILTNVFTPCNGRLPTLMALAALFAGGGLAASLLLCALVLGGCAITLGVCYLLSRTFLKGLPSYFVLELPPFRKPQVGRVLLRSLLDRTALVLVRAVTVAAPAGALLWVLSASGLAAKAAAALDPLARVMGLDGFILLAFVLGWPANEIVLPVLLACYLSAGTMVEAESLAGLKAVLEEHGWTHLTALCYMLFSLLHFPCGTTLVTIYRETGSLRWVCWAVLIPLATACLACTLVAQLARALGLVTSLFT
ncbi:nucleoside recognition domain-containing protein [Desulfovirgula thermocuniculi]|uniref:nucleoside recognition domain-containing protein n=1 Tax=Desulfovirgula thermocuniculi TaxID=348842 RepID=UPI00040CE41E|nr:nucleoside recognition domain-containing protein [Desulfovirgula thermocuniculi]